MAIGIRIRNCSCAFNVDCLAWERRLEPSAPGEWSGHALFGCPGKLSRAPRWRGSLPCSPFSSRLSFSSPVFLCVVSPDWCTFFGERPLQHPRLRRSSPDSPIAVLRAVFHSFDLPVPLYCQLFDFLCWPTRLLGFRVACLGRLYFISSCRDQLWSPCLISVFFSS